MRTHFFAWLGSKRARKQGVADRGSLLDEAARLRLPVPNGGILLDIYYRLLLQEELLAVSDTIVKIMDPAAVYELLYDSVRFPRLDRPVFLRDTAAELPQITIGPLTLDSPQNLAAALNQYYTVLQPLGAESRRDMLIITAINAGQTGTAVSRAGGGPDPVTIAGQTRPLPRLGRWQLPAADQPPHLRRLQQLLRGLRRALGGDETWQIEWLDDGDDCWLLQIDRL